mmetsp:Transcript_12009/g.20293  ORF Transcript_12009/g.20293 Transcript_12009/m.20293 type:complete len:232 (-) Transcript_12009:675-1370(-)
MFHGKLHDSIRAQPPLFYLVFAKVKEDVRIEIHSFTERGIFFERSNQRFIGQVRQLELQLDSRGCVGTNRQLRQRGVTRLKAHHVRHCFVHQPLPGVPIRGGVVVHHTQTAGGVHDQNVLVVPTIRRVSVQEVSTSDLSISRALWDGVQSHHEDSPVNRLQGSLVFRVSLKRQPHRCPRFSIRCGKCADRRPRFPRGLENDVGESLLQMIQRHDLAIFGIKDVNGERVTVR